MAISLNEHQACVWFTVARVRVRQKYIWIFYKCSKKRIRVHNEHIRIYRINTIKAKKNNLKRIRS